MGDLAWIRLEQTVPGKPINVEYIRGFETNTSSENVIAIDSRLREQPKDIVRVTGRYWNRPGTRGVGESSMDGR